MRTMTSVLVAVGSSLVADAAVAADFSGTPVVVNAAVAANSSGVAVGTGGTITFADTAVSQDACKGATVTITATSN